MVKTRYQRKPVSGKRKGPLKTIPDQSMSIQEIVRRFVKGIPMDIEHRQEVFSDQDEHDLEKLSRMDFGDKHQFAQDLEADRLEKVERARQAQQAKKEKAKQAKQKAETEKAEKASGSKTPGIVSLDNTMPDDTSTDSQ